MTFVAVWLCLGGADAARSVGLSAYQLSPFSGVGNAEGAPQAGEDPAGPRQVSLAEAARGPNGIGTWGGKPARGIKPGTALRSPGDVLPHRNATGVTSGGCLVGYGDPGAQCVPARNPGDRPLTCSYLVTLFPTGVRVAQADSLQLDSNRNGRACGRGDKGVPLRRHK